MSPRNNGPMSDGLAGPDSGPALAGSRQRAATVTIRRAAEAEERHDLASLTDPATKSLADALKISYRLLMIAMVGLVALYALSGFHSVKEGERAIRLRFGQPTASELPPGFQFALPEPFGELLRVSVSPERQELRKEFFPNLTPEDENLLSGPNGATALGNTGYNQLDPEADGAVLTADYNIAHVRVAVTYRRDRPYDTVRNIDPAFERALVTAAVRRGVVHAASQVTLAELIDDRLDPALRKEGVAFDPHELAQREAQKFLDAQDSGIQIQELLFPQRMAPRAVIGSFNQVQSAQSTAGKEIEDARAYRAEQLTQAAGGAAEVILAAIDRYEAALDSGDAAKAESELAVIEGLMLGEPVTIDGEQVVASPSGKVTSLINEARSYQVTTVTRAQSDARRFDAKLAAFKQNPTVVVSNDWADAFGTFMRRDTVQVMQLPATAREVVLDINRDPRLAREQEIARIQREGEEAVRKRQQDIERQRYLQKTDANTRRRASE